MANFSTKIGRYQVEVTSGYTQDSGTNGCWIMYKTPHGVEYSASLACLEGTGELFANDGRTHAVSAGTVVKITEYSASKGY